MEFVQMKCPNCNADLDIDEGIDSFYCKYCGTKILVNGQSKHVVNAKAKIRMMDKLGDMQKELHRAQAERARRKAEEAKKVLPWLLGIFLFVIILSLSIAFFSGTGDRKEEAKLEAIYAEIQEDIRNGEYTEALVKTNSLHMSGGSNSERQKWDEIREGIIEIIDGLQ